jgi:hypothetical protein
MHEPGLARMMICSQRRRPVCFILREPWVIAVARGCWALDWARDKSLFESLLSGYYDDVSDALGRLGQLVGAVVLGG